MHGSLIPAVDATAVPGPLWLFHLLLVLTFFLHVLFMNLTLGGTLLAAASQAASRGRTNAPGTVLAGRLMAMNNYGISLTITTGVAPLLFVQVLYQQYFYPATILLGWVWFLFLVMLTVGYYAAYAYKFRGVPSMGRGGATWLFLSAVMFLLIAMVHVAVNLVHSQPSRWGAYATNPFAILADPAFFPRLLHFVFAAVAFSAMVATWWAVRRARRGVEPGLNRAIARIGWRWAMWTTVFQILDGLLFLLVLPADVLRGLMRGGPATLAPFGLSVAAALVLVVMLAGLHDPVERPGTVNSILAILTVVIAMMSVTRHQVRALYLAADRARFHVTASPQWSVIALFLVLLAAGLALVAFMVHRVLTSPAGGDEAA